MYNGPQENKIEPNPQFKEEHHMKKTMALALALVLLVSLLTACGGGGKYAAAGEYLCTSMTAEGLTMDPSAWGLEIVLTLKDDGTGSLKYAGDETEPLDLTWSQNGDTLKITINGEAADVKLDGDTIALSQEGAEMIFTKK